MSANILKKNLVFSSVEVKELIDQMVSDESYSSRRKPSAVLETILLNELLTENNYVRNWILRLYMEEDSIGEVIQSIFNFNSAGIDGKSRGLPLLKLLEFISFVDIVSDTEIDYTKSQEVLYDLNRLKEFCEEKSKIDNKSKEEVEKIISSLDFISEEIQKKKVNWNDFYYLVVTYWKWLKDSTYTFRAQEDYMCLKKRYTITQELRSEFVSILRELAENWNES